MSVAGISEISSSAGVFPRTGLGNLDDAGNKGSSDYHGPKQADWGYFVGSFKYTLYRLQERVVGQGPNPPALKIVRYHQAAES
ncbi:hypothetical protein CCUG60884_01851 [Mycobacteroides salmoniphilum]|uniref:Uncharacterized protein n=1 Tax=Mycobacteroides salmoniphilum TaxID=404941 RepID=A0A4R8SWU7_9MYCO|nr:hypothetical protein CCUG60884_01851 [Mycobacteroides salmoniphilum]